MDTVSQLFLEAVKASLKNERISWQREISAQQWKELFRLASTHQMLPMVYEAVQGCPALASAEPALLAQIRGVVLREVSIQARKTLEFLQLYRRVTAAGISALVVKGIVCRELYPMPDYRTSGDEDVLILPEQYEACKAVFTGFGMVPSEPEMDEEASYEVPFGRKGSPIYIELHKSLFPPQSDAYGDFNRFFEGVHDRAAEVKLMGTVIRTMSPTDHLFYLICHAFKHFLHSGFGIRQVCDMVLFANTYGPDICWDRVLENCRAIRADRFAAALFAIGEEYLTFAPEKACYPGFGDRTDTAPLLEDLLCAGVYGDAEASRKHSSNITLEAVSAQKKGETARGSLASSLFPPAAKLEGRYPYLKDKPWLLPVAWASRMVRYGKRGKTGADAAESLRLGNRRVELMRHYGIIE